MECNEKFLRQLLSSPYSRTVGAAILERLDDGSTITILLPGGQTMRLESREEALRVLHEHFGWRPEQD